MFMETVAPQEAEMGMMKILRERSSVKASTQFIINHISVQSFSFNWIRKMILESES